MPYLLVRHKVEDFDKWYAVFASHAEAQKEAGFGRCRIMRDAADPNMVSCFFEVTNIAKAREFTRTPEASEAAVESGVTGTPKALWLDEI